MRNVVLRSAGLALLIAGAALVTPARAQNFAGAQWIPLTMSAAPVGDPVGDAVGGGGERDIVGDAANPAAFIFQDAQYMYFRLRVSGDPIQNGSFRQFGWGCVVEADNNAQTYEFLAVVNGIEPNGPGSENDAVEWAWNQTTTSPNSVGDVANATPVAQLQRSVHTRVVDAGSTFGGNPDFFIDWAVPLATIRAGGGPDTAPGVPSGTKLRFACGTSNNARDYSADPACALANNQCTLENTLSDPFICNDTGCAPLDSDSDGVPDVIEVQKGTNPNNPDTDGDGITDNIELSATGSTGPFTGPDTDGDGTIDAKDLDSDNDCAPDQTEGVASYRTASASPSGNCSGATPVCDVTIGVCKPQTPCDGNFGSGSTNACPLQTAPKCQTTGALTGVCTQCGDGVTNLCSGGTPICNLTTGFCSACTGDNGTAGAAACPSDKPVCNTTGGFAGQCTQCTAASTTACTGATPTCNVTNGTCAPCNADRGGNGSSACPTDANPYCNLPGSAAAGTCGKCNTTTSACGTGHTGPTCNATSGACTDVDTDGDGVNDATEVAFGTDPTKKDTDGDGIEDKPELTAKGASTTSAVDTDGDGTIDAKDLDSDGDGIPDKDEGVADVDSDGNPNYRDTDDDGDTILTKDEIADATQSKVTDDVDGDGKKNYYDNDADGDGQTDGVEGRPDKDGDGKAEYLDPAGAGASQRHRLRRLEEQHVDLRGVGPRGPRSDRHPPPPPPLTSACSRPPFERNATGRREKILGGAPRSPGRLLEPLPLIPLNVERCSLARHAMSSTTPNQIRLPDSPSPCCILSSSRRAQRQEPGDARARSAARRTGRRTSLPRSGARRLSRSGGWSVASASIAAVPIRSSASSTGERDRSASRVSRSVASRTQSVPSVRAASARTSTSSRGSSRRSRSLPA